MKKIITVAVLFTLASTQAIAANNGFYIGAGLSSVAYPNWTDDANQSAIAAGFSSARTKQDRGSLGLEIRAGQWLNDNFGWEAGYADMGNITGRQTLTGPTVNYNYKYSATAYHLALLGGIRAGKGTVFGKLGMFQATTKLEENAVSSTGSFAASYSESSNGTLVGGGFSFPFTPHISGKVEFDLYNGTKFTNDFTIRRSTDTRNLSKLTVGLDYTF